MHVAEELVLAAQLRAWQVLEVEVITLWGYGEDECSVVILLKVGLSVLELGAAENKDSDLAILLIDALAFPPVAWHRCLVVNLHLLEIVLRGAGEKNSTDVPIAEM